MMKVAIGLFAFAAAAIIVSVVGVRVHRMLERVGPPRVEMRR